MYCRKCGRALEADALFCPICGTAVNNAGEQSLADELALTTTAVHEALAARPAAEDKPLRVWTIFSIVGKILGIVCLITSIIPYLNYFSLGFGIVGIVMSCLGRKAKTEETDRNCRLGLKLSIAAVVLSAVMIIVYLVVFIVVLESSLYRF